MVLHRIRATLHPTDRKALIQFRSISNQTLTIGPLLKAVYNTDATDPQVIAAHANYMIQIIFEGIKA